MLLEVVLFNCADELLDVAVIVKLSPERCPLLLVRLGGPRRE